MPTTKLGLPLITGNQSADVVRDMNALAEEIDLKAAPADDVTTHLADDTRHVTTNDRTSWSATDNAKFKKSNSTYTDNDTAQTFTDAFCTINSLVTIVITSATPPKGVWSVNSANGSFTISSTVAEDNDITFDYYIQKAVG